jgi:hypothetical protein
MPVSVATARMLRRDPPAKARTRFWTGVRRWRTIPFDAWLTVESRSSIEARRLEGLLLRVRVAIVAAPEHGPARWWCACAAPPR